MVALRELGSLSDEQLQAHDPAILDLACLVGLPGAADVDFSSHLRQLDAMAERSHHETHRLRYLFERRPEEFNHSFAVFQAGVLTTVLQRDFGLQYPQDLIGLEDSLFFREPKNLFVHGALEGRGTCASLPAAYLAVGWRLGYPLKLVLCFRHAFVRWDGGGERFNIECTSCGFVSHSDDYYRTWPAAMTEKQIELCQALRSLSPREMLSAFMMNRGLCWQMHGCYKEAVSSFVEACELSPKSYGHVVAVIDAMNAWDRQLSEMIVPGFPSMTVRFPQRRYSAIPRELELEIMHMIIKENFLLSRSTAFAGGIPSAAILM